MNILIRPVENSIRFINYLIDSIVFMFIVFLHAMVLDVGLSIVPKGGFTFFPQYLLALYIFYYWLFEEFFQKTPGKYVTKTKVVNQHGQRAGAGKLFIRSLSRVIPFEAFSFFFSNNGWHDTISKTYVVKDKKI